MSERFFSEFEEPTYEQWKDAAIKALKGAPFEKKMFTQTYEGITLEPIYDKDTYDRLAAQMNNLPGMKPYLRSTDIAGKKFTGWDISQKINYPLPYQINEALRYDLNRGQNSIYLEYGSLTSSNDKINENASNINSLDDLDKVLEKIDVDNHSIYLKDNSENSLGASLLLSYFMRNKKSLKNVKAYVMNDPLSHLLKNGELTGSINDNLDLIASNIREYRETNVKVLAIDASVYHNGGANAVSELSAALATGVYYIREMLERGISVDQTAQKMIFVLPVGTHFFMEIAKFRAARVLWSKIVESFGGDEESQKMFIHTETSLRETTKYDPWVNMLRATSETFSAIAGNVDSIKVTNYDELWGMPNEFSRRTSRNTQNVLKYESHLNDTADPAGGSWFVESLTIQIAQKAWDKFREIEEQDGILNAIKNNFVQKEVEAGYLDRKRSLSTRKDIILGTNKYPNLQEKRIENTFKAGIDQIEVYNRSIQELIENRDNATLNRLLDEFEQLKLSTPEMTAKIASAYNAGALTFEIIAKLFKSNEKAEPIPLRRSAKIFEEMREASESFEKQHGKKPQVNLVCWGLLKEYKPRADFASDFFQVGGFETQQVGGFQDFDDMAKSLIDFKESVFVFCSTDDKYEEFITRIAGLLKKSKPFTKLILAGYPKDKVEEYKNAGIDEFIHVKANIYEILTDLQKDLGIRK